MVICTPFDKPGHFYYNQKINCMRAKGSVKYGARLYEFDPADSFAVLDWGRGVWTYHNTWYWGSASYHVDGVPFGWNIGYGFGNTAAASENVLFYNGRAHKLSQVKFNIPGGGAGLHVLVDVHIGRRALRDGLLSPCSTAPRADVMLIKSDQHQVFGMFRARPCSTTARSSRCRTSPALPKRSKTSGSRKQVIKTIWLFQYYFQHKIYRRVLS